MEQYYTYKKLVTETFMKSGGTLSHHHAIGYEHLPWMEEEISKTGVHALRALKASLDPKAILNPGKLIPDLPPTTTATTAVASLSSTITARNTGQEATL